MAASGWAAEFGKLPLAQRVGVFVGIGVALGGLYYVGMFKDLRTELDAARSQAEQLSAEEVKLTKEEKEYEQLKVQLVALQAEIDANNKALPTAAELPAFFETLQRKTGEAGVEVRRWDYQKESAVEEFLKVAVEIEVVGTFYELKRFFYLLYKLNQTELVAQDGVEPAAPAPGGAPRPVEEKNRVLTIESLKLETPTVLNNELVLSATFRASTFRQELPESEAKAKDAKKPTDADKKPAAGPADGKQPPADKPADKPAAAPSEPGGMPGEAKRKTEDAMDKTEDRADNAGTDKVKGGL